LLKRSNAVGIGRQQRYGLSAKTHHASRSDFRYRGGLSNARGADEGKDTALVKHSDGINGLDAIRERAAKRWDKCSLLLDLTYFFEQGGCERRGEARCKQLFEHLCASGRNAFELSPGVACDMRFEKVLNLGNLAHKLLGQLIKRGRARGHWRSGRLSTGNLALGSRGTLSLGCMSLGGMGLS
jgi:hypothetical protein